MHILVVDDENLASDRIKRLLNELNYNDVTIFNDAKEALDDITKNKYDLVFLDVQMPHISGLELANQILEKHSSTFVIFQTAYENFALEAFEAGGLDYILKPITLEALRNSLNKVQKYQLVNTNTNQKIMGKYGNKIYLASLDEIYYIKADLDEVIIKIKHASLYLKKKISDMEILLKGQKFFRIHRSIIVNVDKIKSMQSIEQSKFEIHFDGIDDIVTSSKEGAKEFREYLEKNTL